jgi:hypothetical protein
VAQYRKELEAVMVLLMYEDPSQSPMASILSDDSLSQLASEVNGMLLEAHGY